MRLFDWVYKLTIIKRPSGFIGSNPGFFEQIGNALEISNLTDSRGIGNRIQFEVKKNLGKEPNTCKVTISNLSEHTRSELEETKPLGLILAAGFRDSGPRILFQGDITRCFSDLKGTDYETTMQIHEGGRAFAYARTNKSYKSGVRVQKVLEDAAATFGMKLPPEVLADPALKQTIPTGMSFEGPTRDFITRVLAPYGYNWSFQNNRLQILKDGQLKPGYDFLIDQAAGLIGTPQRTTPDKPKGKSELTFETLLYPELFPGADIKLKSATFDGSFRIKELTAKGDSYGDDWKSEVRCL